MARISLALALVALILAIVPLIEATTSVTSVGLALPNTVFKVANSPVTSSGTLTGTFLDQKANTFLGGPLSGPPVAPAFRALALSDLPAAVAYVQAFGAKCDGRTDDFVAFQRADSLSTGAISVPPGTCVFGTSITLVHQLAMSPGAVLSIAVSAKLSLLTVPIASPQQRIFSGGRGLDLLEP